MSRAIVLIVCLAFAGGIGVYTQYSRGETGEPVFTVPARPAETGPREPAAPEPRRIDPENRYALTRELQRELKRVGCYHGEITGAWTASSRAAMKTFVERVNAALPVDVPDPVLLSLVQGQPEPVCGVACPPGQAESARGTCVPSAMLAKTGKEGADSDKAPAGTASATPPGRTPPEGVKQRRPRKSAQGPLSTLGDFLKSLGIQ